MVVEKVTSRAEKLLEGFKLGDLGAGTRFSSQQGAQKITIGKQQKKPEQLKEIQIIHEVTYSSMTPDPIFLWRDLDRLLYKLELTARDKFISGKRVSPLLAVWSLRLACAVPKWFMGSLKLDLFDGGLGRRLIVCYANKTRLNENPCIPADGEAAKQRALDHLRTCLSEGVQGELKKTHAADLWWKEWYHDPKRFNQTDPILGQFDQTKHIQSLKVATLLSMSEQPFTYKIEDYHLQAAVAMLSNLEPSILRLTSGIGRNELAGVGVQLLEFLERTGGMQTEINVKKFFYRYANMPEFQELENHYLATGQLVITVAEAQGTGTMRRFYFTQEGYEKFKCMQADAKKGTSTSTAATPAAA